MKWYYYLFGHEKRMSELKLKLADIKMRQTRLYQATALHREVLYQYGIEYQKKLASIDEIINDDKTVTIINYLNI